jgi:hypothetical protein
MIGGTLAVTVSSIPDAIRRRSVLATFVVVVFAGAVVALLWPRAAPGRQSVQATVVTPEQERRAPASAIPSQLAPHTDTRVSARAAVGLHEPANPLAQIPEVTPNRIDGFVEDDTGRRVPGIEVEAAGAKGGAALRSYSDATGRFTLDPPHSGVYFVRIVDASLPSGLLGHYDAHGTPPEGEASAYDPRRVRVPRSEGSPPIRLRVFLAATVTGYVVGQDGEPIEGAHVRVQSVGIGQPTGMSHDARSDAGGRFVVEGVRAGRYRLYVWRPWEHPRALELRSPMPIDMTIDGARRYDVGTLSLAGGRNVVRGTVVDQDGRPFAGVDVYAYAAEPVDDGFAPHGFQVRFAETTTDDAGCYELDRLPSVRVRVAAGNGYMQRPLGERRVAFWVHPATLDLRSGGNVHVAPQFSLHESRPFTVRGEVFVDRAWLESGRQRVRLDVEITPDPAAPFTPERHAPVADASVEIEWHADGGLERRGSFVWRCETPHPRMTVRVRMGGREHVGSGVHVHPEPRGSTEVVLRVPG